MTTLSVPLAPKLENIIDSFIKDGYAPNKAEVVRKALIFLAEERAIQDILEAEQEVRDGKYFKGDLDELVKKICK